MLHLPAALAAHQATEEKIYTPVRAHATIPVVLDISYLSDYPPLSLSRGQGWAQRNRRATLTLQLVHLSSNKLVSDLIIPRSASSNPTMSSKINPFSFPDVQYK